MGALKSAQMGVGDVVVVIFCLAADAVGSVRDLRLLPRGDGSLLQSVKDGSVGQIQCQGGGEGAVGIEAEHRIRCTLNPEADILQRVGHLTVAVQLVAKEIGHQNHLRLQLGEHGS